MAVRREIPLTEGQHKFVQTFAAIGATVVTGLVVLGTPFLWIFIPIWAGFIAWLWQRTFPDAFRRNENKEDKKEES